MQRTAPHVRFRLNGNARSLEQRKITSGHWSGPVNISRCIKSSKDAQSTGSIKLTAEVLDRGTGNRVKSDVEIDCDLAGFEFISLRPGYYRGSDIILILVKSVDGRLTSMMTKQEVTADVRCISTDKKQTLTLKSYTTTVGSLIAIPFTTSLYEHSCRVLLLQGHRKIGRRLSRVVMLVLPSLDNSKRLQQDWIQWPGPSSRNDTTYRVGEKFRASVSLERAQKLNYMVVCQGESIIKAGRVRDDGEITFETTAAMVPYCVLYVFSVNGALRTDMMLFFVVLSCKNSVAVSKASIAVGDNLTITINGGSNGLALLSAVDIRMLELVQKYSSQSTTKYWDLSVGERSTSLQALFLGLIDSKSLHEEIKDTCQEAGVLMLQHLKRCPNFVETSAAVSDLCLRYLILACERFTGPTSTSTVCDRKTGLGCDAGGGTGATPVKMAATHIQFMMASVQRRGKARLDDSASVLLRKSTDLSAVIRQYFPEVWLFEDFSLGASGTRKVTARVPDSVTQWYVKSSAWTPGDLTICQSTPSSVVAEKKLFMNVELPKHVYVNESVAARVSVVTEQIEDDMTFSVCLMELDRHVCGDVGAHGERGQPAYTRIHLTPTITTSAKVFTLRFLRTGETEVIFTLKEEISYPGRYHCNVGEIYDAVKLKIFVSKRSETEEHFKRLVLNPRKPLNRLTRPVDVHYLLLEGETEHGKKNTIDYSEYRSEMEPQKLITNISINLPDTESVFSITIDLSQFLSEGLITDPAIQNELTSHSSGRWKRNAIAGEESFLTDVISSLARSLYQFKSLHLLGEKTYQGYESFDDAIGSLMSAMLTFSSCRGPTTRSCAFSNHRNPQQHADESFFLTALSTSLLCEAAADERIICPLLSYVLNEIAAKMETQFAHDYFLDYLDFATMEDRGWFAKAMVNQLSFDCAAYQCVYLQRNDRAWISLRKSFFNLSDRTELDVRTMAALAFMAPRPVSSIMRIKMTYIVKDGMLPYWTAGKISDGGSLFAKLRSRFNDLVGRRITKSGDLLANSLGLLAFISRGVDPGPRAIELDLLADWIYEQLNEDGQTPSALDAYFANRAIYEYGVQKNNRRGNKHDLVTVSCKGCKLMAHNVTDTPTIFYLPVTVRNITLVTEGDAKVRAGIRVLAAKRMRLRRGLEQNDFYPTIVTVVQHVDSPGVIRQEVCLKVLSALIETLEITHGLFTGFSSRESLFRFLPNTTALGVRLMDRIAVSTYAVHFVLMNLKSKIPLCYELGITEPKSTYEPDQLAPVAVTVRHPLYDIVGQALVVYTDRFKRSPLEEAIDMVCWDGSCSCAEASCTVRCSQCRSITKEHLHRELCSKNIFGATVEVESHRTETLRSLEYFVINVSVKHWKQNGVKTELQKPDRMEVWLRTCNIRCSEPRVGDTYYFSGNINGIVVDFNTRMHYVLRDDDRWELASEDCGHLFSYLITSRPCSR